MGTTQVLRCNDCGSTEIVEIDSMRGIGQCRSCGAKIVLPQPKQAIEILTLLDKAYLERKCCDFDKAMDTYELILSKDSNELKAYEGYLFSKYGIELVEEKRGSEKRFVPVCHRANFKSIFEDTMYLHYVDLCNFQQKQIAESQAKKIDFLLKEIENQMANEQEFDVFISYKKLDENRYSTLDSRIARQIYNRLSKEGYKVFFAEETLKNRIGEEYEPIIFKALHTAKMMVLVGTKEEYVNSTWVRNEWSRFIDRINDPMDNSVKANSFVPVFFKMNAYDMPKIGRHSVQGVNAEELDYLDTLIANVKKVVGNKKSEKQLEKDEVKSSAYVKFDNNFSSAFDEINPAERNKTNQENIQEYAERIEKAKKIQMEQQRVRDVARQQLSQNGTNAVQNPFQQQKKKSKFGSFIGSFFIAFFWILFTIPFVTCLAIGKFMPFVVLFVIWVLTLVVAIRINKHNDN